MNSYLLSRSLGFVGPQVLQKAQTTGLLHALQAAPTIRFNSGGDAPERKPHDDGTDRDVWAHQAGVNTLVIDRFEGR